jgi:hypothetical protein
MDYSKPTLLVISGPNGAGKSTFIASLLPEAFEGITSFDRDKTKMLFEQELSADALPLDELAVRATRLMEASLETAMDKAIAAKDHFVLETPLSHPDYWKYIDRFERDGYRLQLNYLCLDNVRPVNSGWSNASVILLIKGLSSEISQRMRFCISFSEKKYSNCFCKIPVIRDSVAFPEF